MARKEIWKPRPDEFPLATKSIQRFLEWPVNMTGSSCEWHVSNTTPVLGRSEVTEYIAITATQCHAAEHCVPVFLIVSTSSHSWSSWMFEMMARMRLFLPGRTRQWHSWREGYSPGKFGDSRIPRPSLV